MLTFEAPFYQIKNVIVFRDHAVKTQFYYLAGLPKLSVDANKKKQFALLKYHNALDAGGPEIKNRDALGGAFLMLGVDCAVDADSLKGELSSLAEVQGDITLLPVLYTSGTAQIVVLDYQPPPPQAPGLIQVAPPVSHFVKAVVGSTTPSLLGDQRAIFSISLDTDAATLIEAAYQNDMSPIGVIYHLEFSGLRPAIAVSAVVNYQRVYDQLKIDFQFGLHTDSAKSETTTPKSDTTTPTTPTTPPGTTQNPAAPPGTTQKPATGPAGGSAVTTPVAGTNISTPPLTQPIQFRVQTAGALGTAVIRFLPGATFPTDTTGTPLTLGTPGQTNFRWTVPGVSNLQLDFPAGSYAAGDQFTVTVNRVITRSMPAPGTPHVTVVAAATPVAPPPAVNTPPPVGLGTKPPLGTTPPPGAKPPLGGTPPPGTTNPPGTPAAPQDTKSSDTQVAVDINIDYTMQKLVESGAITITIVRQQEGKSVDDMQKEAMDMIRDDILKTFFTPQMTTLPAAPAPSTTPTPTPGSASAFASSMGQQNANATQKTINPGSTTSSGTKVTLGFQLQEVHQDVLRTATFDYSVQSPVTQVHAPNGFFSALISNTNKDQMIKEVSLDDDFFKTVQVTASSIADFATIDLKTAVLDLAYGGTVDEPTSVLSPTFTAADNAPKTFQSFVENGEMAYRFRSSYYFGQNALVGAQTSEYHTPWRTTLSRALVVNPPIDVPMLHVYVAPGLIDWDLIAKIETTLSYDDPANRFHAEHTFMVDQSFLRDDWIVRLTDPSLGTYTVQNTWIMKDNERRITGPVQQMSAAQYFVFDPFVDRMPVIVQPEVDPANVSRVTIAFHYQDAASQLDVRKLVELLPPYHTTVVSLPLMNAKKREYSYQTTLFKATGGAENRPEVTTDQISVIVADGSLPFDVSVMLVGDLGQAGLTALQVDLRAEPLDGQSAAMQSHLFEGAGDTKWVQRLSLRTDRPDHTYQVQTTAFYTDKDPVQSDWNNYNTSILVLQPSRLKP